MMQVAPKNDAVYHRLRHEARWEGVLVPGTSFRRVLLLDVSLCVGSGQGCDGSTVITLRGWMWFCCQPYGGYMEY